MNPVMPEIWGGCAVFAVAFFLIVAAIVYWPRKEPA